jgi:hypothetical protein
LVTVQPTNTSTVQPISTFTVQPGNTSIPRNACPTSNSSAC